ncbi:MAG: hypothetical protein L6W00_02245 [Lentisphaeria bacterium]|nr:MAG: hypothetical protein L6W00_02245 [Lentisphaeria bacterium]
MFDVKRGSIKDGPESALRYSSRGVRCGASGATIRSRGSRSRNRTVPR